MSLSERPVFPARMASLSEALACVQEFCASNGIVRRDMLRLTLVVEELFTNTVVHGHGGGSDASIRIGLDTTPEMLALQYEDEAPAFDPWRWLDAAPPDLDAAARPVGGLGLHLVAQLADSRQYAWVDGRNRLLLTLQRQR